MNNDSIIVQLVAPNGDQLRLAGVRLDIQFYVAERLRYSFDFGSTDDDGICRSSLTHVQEQLDSNRKFFLMDYNTPLDECDSIVGIAAPTAQELADRQAAREKWFGATPANRQTANQSIGCDGQKFALRDRAESRFELVCYSNSTIT